MTTFDLDILKTLGEHHKKLMNIVKNELINGKVIKTNKDLYILINQYYQENNLNKAFPIGISINNIIAHDSYHPENIIIFKKNDFIKVDVGIEEKGNIIDGARTYEYGIKEENETIKECEKIVETIEEYIRKEIKKNGKIQIQKISILTNIEIQKKNKKALDFLGGHNIEKGCVHGKKMILNKPLHLLPDECAKYIDKTAEITNEEMFAIEVYLPDKPNNGIMIQNVKIPVTHYEIDRDFKMNLLNVEERKIFQELKNETKNLPYEYHINEKYCKKIIKSLINKEAIIKHLPLEWKDTCENIKYIQYEDSFIIKNNELLNLTKK